MGYKVYKIQNDPLEPDIVISEGSPEWNEAYQKWLKGKNPTDSELWQKGVVAITKKKE